MDLRLMSIGQPDGIALLSGEGFPQRKRKKGNLKPPETVIPGIAGNDFPRRRESQFRSWPANNWGSRLRGNDEL
jgi:hypothetical protein